jgi:hypothetical protein
MEINTTRTYKRDAVFAFTGMFSVILFMVTTNPQQLSVFMLLVLPILVAFTSYIIIKLFIELFTDLPPVRYKQTSAILAGGVTLIVLLSSLHQLGLQDFILSALLILGFSWYLRRLNPLAEEQPF